MTPTPSTFSKVLPYKWEAYCCTNGRRYCSTNGRCIVGLPLLQSLEASKAQRYKWGRAAVQIGGVLQYFLRDQWGLWFPKLFWTFVTPENSWGTNCVILEGPMESGELGPNLQLGKSQLQGPAGLPRSLPTICRPAASSAAVSAFDALI